MNTNVLTAIGVFFAHLVGLTLTAALAFAVMHGGFPECDFIGVALGCLTWAAIAAAESWVQPATPVTVAGEDSVWRKRALAALFTLPFTAAADAAFHPATLGAGGLLLLLGAALRIWSLAALGRQFTWTTGIVAGHTMITSGPYRYLKHPNYLGNAFFAAGIALSAGSRIAWILVGVLTLSVVLAARHEAAFLRKHLPGYR